MNPAQDPTDIALMREALALARRAVGLSDPNPRVGCVITRGGQVLVSGHTQEAGGPHAEAAALQQARERGLDLRGATVHVSLEPCSHHGRTPPCADALVSAGVARVVVPCRDPNPLVAGRGLARLRAAGIEVVEGVLAEEARELNLGFFSRMLRGRPWVRLKVAASLDGRTALPDGRSQWITAPPARADGHAWRARAGAILTGIGTVLEDDPRLDARLAPTPRHPPRVIVDSRLQTPPGARILAPPGPVWIYAAQDDPAARQALEQAGAQVRLLPAMHGKVDLPALMRDLAQHETNDLHVEAGHKLNGSLWREDLVDELIVYLAPRLLGAGREMAHFGPLHDLAQARPLRFLECTPIGDDLRIVARVADREHFS